jgi:hypothetical protein
MVRLAIKDEDFRLAFELLYSFERLFPNSLELSTGKATIHDIISKINIEKEKEQSKLDEKLGYLKSKGIEIELSDVLVFLMGETKNPEIIKQSIKETYKDSVRLDALDNEDVWDVLNDAYKSQQKLSLLNHVLNKFNDAEQVVKIGGISEAFNELTGMTLIREMRHRYKVLSEFFNLLERDHEPADLPMVRLINLLDLKPVKTPEIVRYIESLVRDGYLDVYQIDFSKSFAVFMFLFVHVTKSGLNGKEILNEIGLYRWNKHRNSMPEELLVYFIIPLSFRRLTNMKMGLTVARLLTELRRQGEMEYVEDICRSLQNIEKYGSDELVNRIISYSYFYGDLDAIIKLGELAKVNRSLEKALDQLRGQKRIPAPRNTSRAQRSN